MKHWARSQWLMPLAIVAALLSYPPTWYPQSIRDQLARWLGPSSFRPPPVAQVSDIEEPELSCPEDLLGWRDSQSIDGVELSGSPTCVADNPYAVAAFVRGTNNVSQQTLLESGLTADAVEKGADLDGDGDPDEIHIRLEIVELNGSSPELDAPVAQYAIAPGIQPGFWAFAPKMVGMATESFESLTAQPMLRLPSPAIRIEQGDRVRITLENSHYMPHTIHLHGVDHPFVDAQGEGNDGVPIASESPVLPGEARTYDLQPRSAGTALYHCHVQPHVHVMMGLQGLFIVEENRPDNWLQTLNVGAGHVRVSSRAVVEEYDREFDLHYLEFDNDLNERIQQHNDPRLITESMHRDYDITEAESEYFTLNGRSFPYTFRESLVTVAQDERIRLRVANGSTTPIAFHTHGHKFTITHRDGVAAEAGTRITRDVVTIDMAQRLDLLLETTNDGFSSYGPGIWLFHDHRSRGVTTDGIGPGGNISAIVYDEYLQDDGWPATLGVSFDPYFTSTYYRKERPIWEAYAPELFAVTGTDPWIVARLIGLGLSLGMLVALILGALRRNRT